VKTSDGLTVKTEYLHYKQNANTVETDKPVEFEGRNFSGKATGLFLEADAERVRLLQDVDVTIKDNQSEKSDSDGEHQHASNDAATKSNKPERTAEERAARKAEKRQRKKARREAALARGEAQDSRSRGSRRTGPSTTPVSKKPTRIQGVTALLEKKEHRVTVEQNVRVTQGEDEARADRMIAYTDASNHIERIEARGSSYLEQKDRGELRSPDMDFFFGPSHQLVRGVAMGGSSSRSLGEGAPREASADQMEANFEESVTGSVLQTLTATGHAVVKAHPPAVAATKNPAERQLNADTIVLQFQPDGKNIKTADAVGSALLTVTPVRADPKADKKTIAAPRMNAVFFDHDNKMKTYTASGGVRTQADSMVPNRHPPRITTSKRLTADFLEDTQDIERAAQEGDFKYEEGDRHGTADRALYDGQKEYLQLRGGRPMGWDEKARTQADEIDYDRQNDETHARGDVRTTYYSRDTTNNSTPFSNTKSPVFITAERADGKNEDGIAVYTVNARGWQDDNFVKADRIEMYQNEKRMVAIGPVESALDKAKKQEPGSGNERQQPEQKTADDKKRATSKGSKYRANDDAPGFATSDRMTYSDADRLVHYESSVKARHGTDYIEANSVDVFLEQDSNEVDHLIAEGSVVLIQPGRPGTGDHPTYTSNDGRAVLTGKTARVDDSEKGSTMGSQLTFYSRDDKIFVENQQGTGRVRTIHRMGKH